MAMEARGYSADKPRSRMDPLVYCRNDKAVYAFSALLLAAAIALRIAGLL
jgi:energy-coupling factor transporter transmembrane protein EcfT